MQKIIVCLVFTDWKKNGKSVYATEEGVELSMGSLHSGSVFNAEIELDEDDAQNLQDALDKGYNPEFAAYPDTLLS